MTRLEASFYFEWFFKTKVFNFLCSQMWILFLKTPCTRLRVEIDYVSKKYYSKVVRSRGLHSSTIWTEQGIITISQKIFIPEASDENKMVGDTKFL